MANIVWSDTKGAPRLTEPFLSYRNRTDNKRFTDWLLGISTDPHKGRFGSLTPQKNMMDDVIKAGRTRGDQPNVNDNNFIEYLTQVHNLLIEKENTLYRDLQCGDFYGFERIWKGQTREADERNYWINFHLELFTSEMQRLMTQRTSIEQYFALAAIEMDNLEIIGLEEEKDKIRNFLVRAGTIYLDDSGVYLPRKGLGGNTDFLKEIDDVVIKAIENNTIPKINEEVLEQLEGLGSRIGEKRSKMKKLNGHEGAIATMRQMFVRVDFSEVDSSDEKTIRKAIKQIMNYLSRARVMKMTGEQLESWNNYQDKNKVLEDIKRMCRSYFKQQNQRLGTSDSDKMGVLGELYTFGKNYFNITNRNKNKGMEVFNAATVVDKLGQSIATDVILKINNKIYGIQTKNPFQITKDGEYITYDKDWNLGNEKSVKSLYNQVFHFSGNQAEEFEYINLNANTVLNPQELQKQIISFLFLFSEEFMRLSQNEVDMSKLSEKFKKLFQNGAVYNVFFVLKGKLIQSSYIISNLIEEYKAFIQGTDKNKTTYDPIIINYNNKIEKNIVNVRGRDPFDPSLVKNRNLLENVTITTKLRLKVPNFNKNLLS